MKIKSQKDFWSGLMFIVVGIGFAWGATNYSFGAAARPGPGYFPFGLGILMAILAAVLFTMLLVAVGLLTMAATFMKLSRAEDVGRQRSEATRLVGARRWADAAPRPGAATPPAG